MKKIKDAITSKSNETSLKKTFNDSLKDPIFKEMVSNLSVGSEELMKYTSTLEDSKIEYANCKECKGLQECKNQITGYAYLPFTKNNTLYFEYKSCKYKNKLNKEEEYLKNVYSFDIPEEIKKARIKDIYKEDKNRHSAIKWVTKFIKDYPKFNKGLYLHGNFGCGKTYILAAMINELASRGYKAAIIFYPEFLRDLKASFNTSEFGTKFERVKEVELLLIDDLGAENSTAWSRDEIFCPLIQYRMDNNLPTFFTSNLNLKELERHFSITKDSIDTVKSKRIISRIMQLTDSLEMISPNLRK
jgi:primosomal protein DnaI